MDKSIYEPQEDSYFLSKILEEHIPKLDKNLKNLKVLEIGCGSGIQLDSLIKIGILKKNVFAVDINSKAVNYCKLKGFNCKISNLFENVKEKFDIIIFNPPYLPLDKNEPEESRLATTGGIKGSEIINKFLKQAKNYLNKEGIIFILTSNLTKKVDFKPFKKTLLGQKALFYEKLFVWVLS